VILPQRLAPPQTNCATNPAKPGRGYRGAIQVLVRVVLMLTVLETVLIVLFRLQVRPAIDAVRRFNRAVLNPAMMKLAGSAHWYASAIHHQGRVSGRFYATAVVVAQGRKPLLHSAAVWRNRLVRQPGRQRRHRRPVCRSRRPSGYPPARLTTGGTTSPARIWAPHRRPWFVTECQFSSDLSWLWWPDQRFAMLGSWFER